MGNCRRPTGGSIRFFKCGMLISLTVFDLRLLLGKKYWFRLERILFCRVVSDFSRQTWIKALFLRYLNFLSFRRRLSLLETAQTLRSELSTRQVLLLALCVVYSYFSVASKISQKLKTTMCVTQFRRTLSFVEHAGRRREKANRIQATTIAGNWPNSRSYETGQR